jgi:hypothetical protein
MASSGMLRSVVLVRTDVSEERNASMIRVKIISELGTTSAVTNNTVAQCEEILRASVAVTANVRGFQ